ncbi:sensor histidine kinase [Carbonactinospora thermoautotrophica]|uniref:sensor histidine kinase n=1 Tax=Carbonactinospora thermoautotrophica TaxID=1469144 RepID=UPI001E5C2EF6|nr:histidine kinase [Carbonactinospora thermoautotrophica]
MWPRRVTTQGTPTVQPLAADEPDPPGSPVASSREPWPQAATVVLDVLIVLGCGGFDTLLAYESRDESGYTPLPWEVASALTALVALALLARRRHPLPVTLLVLAGIVLGTTSAVTLAAAVYALAKYTPRMARAFLIFLVTILVLVPVGALELSRGVLARESFGEALIVGGVLTGLMTFMLVGVPFVIGLCPRWWPLLSRRVLWWETRTSMLFDVCVALFAVVIGMAVSAAGDRGDAWALLSPPLPLSVVLSGLTGLLLVLRRRNPAAVTAAGIVLELFGGTGFTVPIGLYSHAKYGRSQRVLVGLVAAAVAGVAAGYAVSRLARGEHRPQDLVLVVFGIGFFVVMPVLLGMYAGARLSLIESLREKAERLEREQHLLADRARMEERARIAREMHDVVAHRVSLMVVHAGALEVSAGDDERAAKTAELIGQIGRQALDELRQVLGVLRLNESEEAPLAPQPTLDDLAKLVDQSRAAGVPVTLHVTGEHRAVGKTAERTAYRVVQEALTNVHKHAGNAATRVWLRYLPDALQVTVENEAPSRCPGPTLPSGGHGLVGLRERVTVLGGTFEAGPRPGGGFRVAALIPTGLIPTGGGSVN